MEGWKIKEAEFTEKCLSEEDIALTNIFTRIGCYLTVKYNSGKGTNSTRSSEVDVNNFSKFKKIRIIIMFYKKLKLCEKE